MLQVLWLIIYQGEPVEMIDQDKLGWAAEMACLLEVSAEKPGNVTRRQDFKDTAFQDFIISASAIGPSFRAAGSSSVGETILSAIQATRKFVDTNTNLGIVLMLAPLAKAACIGPHDDLQTAIKPALLGLSVEDARRAYAAINLAKPAGMGKSQHYDLNEVGVEITLLQAMAEARERDTLALEYVTDYRITFEMGLPALRQALSEGARLPQAIVQTFLHILSKVPDTLIARKKGIGVAQDVSKQAELIVKNGGVWGDSETLDEFDTSLRDKNHSLNPGTTADLIAATLFAYLIEDNFLLAVKDH